MTTKIEDTPEAWESGNLGEDGQFVTVSDLSFADVEKSKTYYLYKLSSPGFKLETTHIEHVYNTLRGFVCGECVDDILDEANQPFEVWNTKTFSSKISDLLWTSCGCEFMIEEKDHSSDQYVTELFDAIDTIKTGDSRDVCMVHKHVQKLKDDWEG